MFISTCKLLRQVVATLSASVASRAQKTKPQKPKTLIRSRFFLFSLKQLTQFRRVIVYGTVMSVNLTFSFELKLETNFPFFFHLTTKLLKGGSWVKSPPGGKRASRILMARTFSFYSNFKTCSKQKLSVSGLNETLGILIKNFDPREAEGRGRRGN